MSEKSFARKIDPEPQTERVVDRPLENDSARPEFAGLHQALGNQALIVYLRRQGIYPKLKVGPVDDQYELEADRVADEVIRMKPDSCRCGGRCPRCKAANNTAIRRKTDQSNDIAFLSINTNGPHGLGPGRPLDSNVRDFFESRFGSDFGNVRIHTGDRAMRAAAKIGARAYTRGQDIVFARNQYTPATIVGKRLLAHELTHVVQQRQTGFPFDQIQRTGGDNGGATTPLQRALDGDDDDVRALTLDPDWGTVVLTAEQAARLMIHLLDGPTGNEDEEAGLRILNKCLGQGILDDALLQLHQRNYLDDLLEDYHWDEYRRLLTLLSQHVQSVAVKTHLIDVFLDMMHVAEHEEQAIVVMLEGTQLNDQVTILDASNRIPGLRSAIDAEALWRRYEVLVANVNGNRFNRLSGQLRTVYTARARASVVAGTRTEQEATELERAAGVDLVTTGQQFRQRFNDAAADASNDADDLADINREFETRLGLLVQRKTREFQLELEHNVQFGRSTAEAGRRQPWTRSGLAAMDRIIEQLPQELLRANPDFQHFVRERRNEDYAGAARSGTGEIALAGTLTLRTTSHELGHFIHFGDRTMFQAFQNLSGWESLTAARIRILIPNVDDHTDMLEELDEDREDEDRDDRERYGNHFYRYNRYGPGYYRYLANSCFISNYAKTDPKDDFADTFEEYIVSPAHLANNCSGKYDFMHEQVFIDYWLRTRTEQLLDQYDERRGGIETQLTNERDFRARVRREILFPLRTELETALEGLRATRMADAQAGRLSDPMPLRGLNQAESVSQPFLLRLGRLQAPLRIASTAIDRFATLVLVEELLVETAYEETMERLSGRLMLRVVDNVFDLLAPVIQEIREGRLTNMAEWPQLEQLSEEFDAALGVLPTYLPIYSRTIDAYQRFLADLPNYMRQVPEASRDDFRRQAFPILWQLVEDLNDLRDEIVTAVRGANPYSAEAGLANPDEIEQPYHEQLEELFERFRPTTTQTTP